MEFSVTYFQTDVMAIPLGGCEMVLRCQWLETLGIITWDLKKLEISFKLGQIKIVYHGIKQDSLRTMKAVKLNKLNEYEVKLSMIRTQRSGEADHIMLYSMEAVSIRKAAYPTIEKLLMEFEDVFA